MITARKYCPTIGSNCVAIVEDEGKSYENKVIIVEANFNTDQEVEKFIKSKDCKTLIRIAEKLTKSK